MQCGAKIVVPIYSVSKEQDNGVKQKSTPYIPILLNQLIFPKLKAIVGLHAKLAEAAEPRKIPNTPILRLHLNLREN